MITIICTDGEKDISVATQTRMLYDLRIKAKFKDISPHQIEFNGDLDDLRKLLGTDRKFEAHFITPDLINRLIDHLEDPTFTISGEKLAEELKQLLKTKTK